jgi:hypothetical protein
MGGSTRYAFPPTTDLPVVVGFVLPGEWRVVKRITPTRSLYRECHDLFLVRAADRARLRVSLGLETDARRAMVGRFERREGTVRTADGLLARVSSGATTGEDSRYKSFVLRLDGREDCLCVLFTYDARDTRRLEPIVAGAARSVSVTRAA